MLLAIDIGNTNTLIGIFDSSRLISKFRLSTTKSLTADECILLTAQLLGSSGIETRSIDGVIISSVVPEVTGSFAEAARGQFAVDPIIVGPHLETGLKICYSVPEEIGADRIVDAVAAWERYGTAVIVVDFGTATTLDVVTGDGRYIGGAICPGIKSGAAELSRRAARLPRVEIKIPKRTIGRNTLESMQSGIIYGAVGQVRELISRLTEELGEKPRVIATGGLVDLVAPELGDVEIDTDLTLKGLFLLYEKNKSK
jgi:type III pantothenate kinase